MLLDCRGFALENLSSVIMGQSLSEGSKYLAWIPRDFSDAANILALVRSPIARMSSRSCSTMLCDRFVSSRRRSVVRPTALTTTTMRVPREYSRATASAAWDILLALPRLVPPNLATRVLLGECSGIRFEGNLAGEKLVLEWLRTLLG